MKTVNYLDSRRDRVADGAETRELPAAERTGRRTPRAWTNRAEPVRPQRHRASGLNLITAAIVLWNTVYLSRAVEHLRGQGEVIDETLLASLSPLGRDHINLMGDYVWSSEQRLKAGEYRALREPVDR